MTRLNRITILRSLLNHYHLGSLEAIRDALSQEGIRISMGTLSADLTQLCVAKVHTPEGVRYVLPDNPLYRRTSGLEMLPTSFRGSGFRRLSFSGNLCVMHTQPGYAAAIASDIDAAELPVVLGTIAGNDTILIILAERTSQETAIDALATIVPAIKSLY